MLGLLYTLYCYSVSGDSKELQGLRPLERGPLPLYIHSTHSARSCVALLLQILQSDVTFGCWAVTYAGEQLVVQTSLCLYCHQFQFQPQYTTTVNNHTLLTIDSIASYKYSVIWRLTPKTCCIRLHHCTS